MAVDLSSSKNLWVLISGTAVLKSQELVGSELEKNSSKIVEGCSFYKKSQLNQELSKNKNDGSIDPNFLKDLSILMNLDINQTYDVICTYLLYEYRGSNSDIYSILKNERHTHELMLEIWNYYHSERIYSLLCLKQLLSFWQDASHAYQSLYEGFLQSVNTSNEKPIIDSVLKQLKAVCSQPIPSKSTHGSLMTDALIMRWAKCKLNEMCELLQIVLLYYKDMEPNSDQMFALFTLFQKHIFGLRHPYRHLIDDLGHEVLKTISYLEVLVLIEAMELEWLYRCQNAAVEEYYLFKDANMIKKMNSAISLLGSKDFHGPIILSWMLVLFYSHNQMAPHQTSLKQLGAKAIQLNAFKYLLSCLELPIFSGKSVIAEVAHEIVYSLLSLLLSTFEEGSLGDQQSLCNLACNLLKYPKLADDFWSKGMETGVATLFSNIVQHFPMNLPHLLHMLSSLASTSYDSSQKVIKIFQSMPFYTEYLDENSSADIVVTSDPTVWQLVRPKMLYPNENLMLKAKTCGQVVSSSSGKQIIQWSCLVNGWYLCLCEVHLLLQQAGSGSDNINETTMNRVNDIFQLCCSVIKSNPQSIAMLGQLTNMAYALAERFSSSSPAPNLLISNCLNVMSLVAQSDPSYVWTNVLKMAILPYSVSSISSLDSPSNLEMNGGIIGNLIASQVYMYGTYSITKAFLKVISSVSQHEKVKRDQCFLACIILIIKEIFPTYQRWRYIDMADRNNIGELCLQIFHKLLIVPDSSDSSSGEESAVQKLIVHALLFTDLGQSLLQVIETGEQSFQMALEEQSSWLGGSDCEVIHVIRLAMSVLNRLLLLKSKYFKAEQLSANENSAVETIISSQPTHAAKKSHFVLTVAHYIFHRYDPRLTTLAVHLLKRIAKEIPISLLACLGNDAEAIRDMFLVRLQSVTEDIRLKIAILEFLSVCIHQQSGLFEMFVNPSSLSNKKGSKDQFSCLQSVLDILEQKEEGASSCRPELYLAAIRFIHSLWYGQKYLAITALKKNKKFWEHLCSPLMAADDDLKVENVTAYVFKILSLEFLYYNNDKNKCEDELKKVLDNFTKKRTVTKWSKMVLKLPELSTADTSIADISFDYESIINSAFLLSAFRDLVVVIAKQKTLEISPADQNSLLEDILAIVTNLVHNQANLKVLLILSQMYYILLGAWKANIDEKNVEKIVENVGELIGAMVHSVDSIPAHIQLSIMTVAINTLKLSQGTRQSLGVELKEWIVPVCNIIRTSSINLSSMFGHFTLNLPVISILLLDEILAQIDDPHIWYDIIHQQTLIALLLSLAVFCLQMQKGHEIVRAIFTLFCKLAEHTKSAEALRSCGLIQQICLPLCTTYANDNSSENTKAKWMGVYKLSIQLMTSMQKTVEHFFFEDAIQFVGVHVDRMHYSLQCAKNEPKEENLSEAIVTCNLLTKLVSCRARWQVTHPQSLYLFMEDVRALCQTLIAYLMRPNYLLHIIKNKPLDEETKRSYIRDFNRMSSCEDSNEVSSDVYRIQNILLQLLALCMKCLRQFTPSMHQLLSEQSVDMSEWSPLLQIGFNNPALDQDEDINFGTMISCINVCVRNLFSKSDIVVSPNKSDKETHLDKSLLTFVLENSLAFLMSQAILYLINPNLNSREKQLLKRELGTELTSFALSLSRCLRRGTNAPPSPAAAGANTSIHRSSSTSPGKSKSLSPLNDYPFVKLVTMIVDTLFK